MVKSLSRDVSDYKPTRNKDEADMFKLKREIDMKNRIEHELRKNKIFHDKAFLSFLKHKFGNNTVYAMANHYSDIVKDNFVRVREMER